MLRAAVAILAGLTGLVAASGPTLTAAAPKPLPRYAHVFVILEENKNYEQVLSTAFAPNIAGLAARYGDATQFWGEVHPSEANYVALLGGDTLGIHDDDAFYCKPGDQADPACGGAGRPGYTDHTSRERHIGDQLEAAGMTWKGYYEDLPEPGSLAVTAGTVATAKGPRRVALYASKHSGFLNFASVQHHPRRADLIVDFKQLDRDIAADALPNFALIVPNQCNEMHGLGGEGVDPDCQSGATTGLIARGDRVVGELVKRLQATKAWRARENMAIVITFDEGAGGSRGGCCGVTPNAASNYGGGHIPTVVITNHGPHGAKDATPYNHYSLLRTFEDVFGLKEHLRYAGDTADGVVPMTPLFQTGGR
ncbi:MAG TPA: alkaline phosphatase family protein [Phenylobacterium sp.]|jgi:hypothetical protein|nr:alkaline phosphatase family protein [Phenylobacterium sp.]